MGNTCFMNSVLQILLHTPPWVNEIIRHSPPKECGSYISNNYPFIDCPARPSFVAGAILYDLCLSKFHISVFSTEEQRLNP